MPDRTAAAALTLLMVTATSGHAQGGLSPAEARGWRPVEALFAEAP